MAKARVIIKRRKAVSNIRRITQTMQLISTARYQKCLQRALATQPYTQKITEIIETLGGQESADHPLLRPGENKSSALVLVITSNRGLCGAYNAAVLRKMMELRKSHLDAGRTITMEVVGKKGVNYLKFLGVPVSRSVADVEDRISFARVSEMAERYMAAFERGELASVEVVYTRFVSVSTQRPSVARLLPIEPVAEAAGAEGRGPVAARGGEPAGRPAQNAEFEFSPPPAELLRRLIPEAVKVRLYQYFNDAIVSEQVARMVAMKAATDAAGDMVKYLSRSYNRARQSQITMELADIVGGANAVQ
ncbi:MAG: ATP synthase F1 subunit gamma [Phycisphaerales bacterium]|nr:ATP synthase F1 subunit gamma [Phycisphaerales bacterium]